MSVYNCTKASIIVKQNNLITETDFVVGNMHRRILSKSIFVTVGTTSFDQLIQTFNNIDLQRLLLEFGYDCVVFQIGQGSVIPIGHCDGLSFEYFTFKGDLVADLNRCDLVISHAGAGTCLDVLTGSCKRLVVVVNDLLMHNHQSELAEKLSERGHCLFSTCTDLLALFSKNHSILSAGIPFQEVFSHFDTDYYANVAKSVEEIFF